MKTFHQDSDKTLLGHLKEAAKKTMSKFKGKELPPYLSKKAIVFAAVAAMSLSGSHAEAKKNVFDKFIEGIEFVERTVNKVAEPFSRFNTAYDGTRRAIDMAEYHMRGTDERLGGALSAGVSLVQGAIDRQIADYTLDTMEQGQDGYVPLVAEQGGQSTSSSQESASSNPSGLNVVGEISVSDLVNSSSGNTSVAGNSTVSSSTGNVSVSSEYTPAQLQQRYANQSGGSAQSQTQVQTKSTKSVNALFARMQQGGYLDK